MESDQVGTNQSETDRVRRYTTPEMLEKIERDLEHNIRYYAVQPDDVIARRLERLRYEWSIERYLQVNVCSVGLLTGLMALTRRRGWAVLTCAGLGFFLYHALQGFDPPIPLLRRMGVRTRREIDREVFALKAVRGDFGRVQAGERQEAEYPARQLLAAVDA